jgi:hypothetical protein
MTHVLANDYLTPPGSKCFYIRAVFILPGNALGAKDDTSITALNQVGNEPIPGWQDIKRVFWEPCFIKRLRKSYRCKNIVRRRSDNSRVLYCIADLYYNKCIFSI